MNFSIVATVLKWNPRVITKGLTVELSNYFSFGNEYNLKYEIGVVPLQLNPMSIFILKIISRYCVAFVNVQSTYKRCNIVI